MSFVDSFSLKPCKATWLYAFWKVWKKDLSKFAEAFSFTSCPSLKQHQLSNHYELSTLDTSPLADFSKWIELQQVSGVITVIVVPHGSPFLWKSCFTHSISTLWTCSAHFPLPIALALTPSAIHSCLMCQSVRVLANQSVCVFEDVHVCVWCVCVHALAVFCVFTACSI